MEDDQAGEKEQNRSSESSTASLDSTGSTSRGGRCSEVRRPAALKYDRDEFWMMPPEEKLEHLNCRVQANKENKEFDACIQDLVRLVALTRLVHGEKHLKLALAHASLAQAYFQFKGLALQALEHSAFAKELLLFRSSASACSEDEKLEALACHLSVHLTQGGASVLTDKLIAAKDLDLLTLKEADSSFLEAEKVLNDLYQHGVVNLEEKIQTQLEISSGLCRVYRRQNRPEEALSQCEKSLDLLKNCNDLEKKCAVYKDMATIEQDRGHTDIAVEYLCKAHSIAMSHSPEGLEGAQISHNLAMILSTAPDQHHNDTAAHYFEQSLRAYRTSVGPHDPAFISAQDDFCRYLLINGQQECLELQTLLYGPQDEKTKAVQKAVNMLERAPEEVERQQRHTRRKKSTFPVIPSTVKNDNSV